jgi:nitrogen regulatory protein PII 2
MKEVLAVIRPNKITPTKEALSAAGFPSLTVQPVVGRGRQSVDYALCADLNEHPENRAELLPLLAQGPQLLAKRLLSLVVPDDRVSDVVDVLIAVNQTGAPGDGKVFVLPSTDAVRVSTGEAGSVAIDEMTDQGDL